MLFADCHVHIYKEYNLKDFFSCAFNNFNLVSCAFIKNWKGGEYFGTIKEGRRENFILYLTERSDCNFFSELLNGNIDLSPDFKITHEEEIISIKSVQFDNKIWIVPGRQIVTKENLEILVYGLNDIVKDKTLTATTIIKEFGGMFPIALPWGFCKWLFSRGRVVKALFEGLHSDSIIFCDSALRSSKKSYFDTNCGCGTKRRDKIIAGTDCLPLHNEERRVGSFGVVLDASCYLSDLQRDFCLNDALKTIKNPIVIYGNRLRFNQTIYRVVSLYVNKFFRLKTY